MANVRTTWKVLRILGAAALVAGGVLWSTSKPVGSDAAGLRALQLKPAISQFGDDVTLKPEQILDLLSESGVEPRTSAWASRPVVESPPPPEVVLPTDLDKLGYNASQFLVDSRWATIRFLGAEPAGAGLSGQALSDAQRKALGTARDTVPVVTAAITIQRMMDDYFVPLLKALPGGEEILPRIKVQGAYFAPGFSWSDGTKPERDNAYIIGLQSLYLYPSSCFDKPGDAACKPPFFSTGHDPTVIGHELGHVIFNHLRRERSLEGFQWFAVNEGYADYFSAAYFNEPIVGRTWRVNRSHAPYLRKLIDTPTTEDPVLLQEGHQFSVVWSSALWRARERLLKEHRASGVDVDRVVAYSIEFLGDTEKPRLGDAATAVLKSAEVLGFPHWKNTYRSEFEKAAISLALPPPTEFRNRGNDLTSDGQEVGGRNRCGVIGTPGMSAGAGEISRHTKVVSFLFLGLPLALALFFIMTVRRGNGRAPRSSPQGLLRFVLSVILAGGSGCQRFFGGASTTMPTAPGPTLVFVCDAHAVENARSDEGPYEIRISWLNGSPSSPIQRVLVSDFRYERSPAAVLLVLDREKRRVDQVRDRSGRPFESTVSATLITSEEARAHRNVRSGTLLLDSAAQAMQKVNVAGHGAASTFEFGFDGRRYGFEPKDPLFGGDGYGPLPRRISYQRKTACTFQARIETGR